MTTDTSRPERPALEAERERPPLRPLTGAQHTIQLGDQQATITEVGAGLRDYTVKGRPLLDGFEADQQATGGRGQTFIPWPNRVRKGRYIWRGQDHQLDLTEPERSGAIHGLTRWANWRLLEQGSSYVRMGHVLRPRPGWPFILGCELEYRLDERGLTVATRVTNLGTDPCPYGTGAHPYFTVGNRRIDEASLRVPASTYLQIDRAGIPIDRKPVEGSAFDFRERQVIGDRVLDVTLTSLERDGDMRARVELQAPDGHGLSVWLGGAYSFVQLYSGDELPEPERRRRGLAIEPMTCAPDAFNSGDGLRTLAPGASHVADWGIEPS